jgi:C-terminal processing protease CtpA/Prc
MKELVSMDKLQPGKQQRWGAWGAVGLTLLAGLLLPSAWAQTATAPPAPIHYDEGGAVTVRGRVIYTDPLFTLGVAEPLVILEDQAGFIDRNRAFLMPAASQVMGQITTDFHTSPFSYTIALPIEPQATRRDVDQDGVREPGVMVYAVAYWSNTFGDPFLEERDLLGGGWSTAYASTRISEAAESRREVIGGQYLVYAPDDQQGFPADFGADARLFTPDDPIITLPPGYTVVNMNTQPFTFDRSRHPVIDLIEPTGVALKDFSVLSYSQAFDAMVAFLRKKYAFTAYKQVDWDELHTRFRPRFESAEQGSNRQDYLRALRDFAFEIPDAHVNGPFVQEDYQKATAGGVGLAVRALDDGRALVIYLQPNGVAARAGIQLRAEIAQLNGRPIADAIHTTFAWSGPFSTVAAQRLQQVRYVLRAPMGTTLTITYQNPGAASPQTVALETVAEVASLNATATDRDLTGFELPVEYRQLASGLGYAKIYSFSDNDRLTILLWERLLQTLNQENTAGLIIDMRQNSGGNGFLADQMAAYFFDKPLALGNTGYYDEARDAFHFDPRTADRFLLPPAKLRYRKPVAVLIGPHCKSACEFFAYDLLRENRAVTVGHYATAGAGGNVADFKMPEGQFFRFTIGRGVDPTGQIHIEGQGVAPTVRVPVTEETLFSADDPILEAAERYLGGRK